MLIKYQISTDQELTKTLSTLLKKFKFSENFQQLKVNNEENDDEDAPRYYWGGDDGNAIILYDD